MARILIVDDDPDVVEMCSMVLQKDGHDVRSAYDRTEGMKALEAEHPDLLILDVIMEQPDDGISMAQDIRRQGLKIPILMLTSMSKVTGLDYGKDEDMVPVNEFVEKPVKAETLLAKVQALLGA